MCGIAGVLSDRRDAGARTAVVAMGRRLRHRGPDGEGVWQSESGCATLANTRLSVFDQRAAANQPMTSESGRFAITYNGAIYNFKALRAELERDGRAFRTESDTEVILRAYEKLGPACVDRLEGMFAFLIWDEAEQRAFAARDHLGIKPLYVAATAGRLTFSSELRAIVASGLVSSDFDSCALYGYFRSGSVQEPATLLRDVRMLPAGARATWQRGTLSVTQPAPLPAPAGQAEGDHVARTRRALADAVERHFAGDVPVGVLLSGGADSAAIVALATMAGQRPRTFSLMFADATDRDGEDAARSAARFGVTHESLSIDAASARGHFTDYLSSIDQPSIDGLNTFIAARFVRERGIKVVMSGIGADELFGGYPTFTRVPMLHRCHQAAALAGPVARWAGGFVQRHDFGPRIRRVGDLLEQPPTIGRAYETFRAVFTRAESRALVRQLTGMDPAAEQDDSAAPADLTAAEAVGFFEMIRYVRNQLLRDSDVMSMASGVELRTPFLDRTLVDTLGRIPGRLRLRPGKRLLKEAVPEIPEWAFATPKRCFQLPFERWFQDDWADVFTSTRAKYPDLAGNWYRSWALLTLERSMDNLKAVSCA
jgi:asparagine synthase (glutamine-hydrolysing)